MLELYEHVEDCWASITLNECKNLYRGMPKCIAAIIATKGRWTKFNFVLASVSKTEFWTELRFTFFSSKHAYLCVVDFNPYGSMSDCNGNPMQFIVSFLVHPISLHCLLNFSIMYLYSVLVVTISKTFCDVSRVFNHAYEVFNKHSWCCSVIGILMIPPR